MAEKVLWSGRFGKGPDRSTIEFTTSFGVDVRLAWYDVMGSLAHAHMLAKQGVLKQEDADKIVEGLKTILSEIESGTVELAEDSEDVHSAVEFLLTKKIGEAGGRLHTARSRNDQVVTDFRLFMRDAILLSVEAVVQLQSTLIDLAEKYKDTILPGFTHVQHAQPITLGFHLMAYAFKLQRDAERLIDSYKRVNLCPLGSAALAGTTYPIDRHMTAHLLGFERPTGNALDTVSDRDFALEYCFASSLCLMHLSSMAEELVLWSSPEFGFVEISEGYSTGSSIMPQKKNPDVAELIRGRSARGTGSLMAMLTLVKGLPLSYNRDLQEDKEAVFRAYDNTVSCLRMMSGMLAEAQFRPERMNSSLKGGFLNATDLADYLVRKGLPFRQAHEVVGKMVRHCIDMGIGLEDMTVQEMSGFSSLIGPDINEFISMERCVSRRLSYGGTAPAQVENQIELGRSNASIQRSFCEVERKRLLDVWNRLIYHE
ncbi:MAG: Fumarate hydratase class II [Methanomassiliicoccales archaeon PtaU1.Bin124]|nr:MAG: Fumarate hydratase class II [Methanomassiliicoccales archaeon PtaU1.Bin124]